MNTINVYNILSLLGIVSFAISGTLVGIRKKMDIFGVAVMAILTCTGGGFIRDLAIGKVPPTMFEEPAIVILALAVSLITFYFFYKHKEDSLIKSPYYKKLLFLSDTLGLAAFTVNGIISATYAGYQDNILLLIFAGVITGTGGGVIRDICAMEIPSVFIRQVYASACIIGAIVMVALYKYDALLAQLSAFSIIVLIRFLARIYEWNLPHVE